MKRKLFSVYDVKAQFYGNPFLFTHKGEAIRAFMTAANDPQTNINRYPEDYQLFYLGEFDDVTGKFLGSSHPEHLNNASEFTIKIKTQNENGAKNVKETTRADSPTHPAVKDPRPLPV